MALFQINPEFSFDANSNLATDNGLWRDPDTGLVWLRCSLGQNYFNGACKGKAFTFSWKEGLKETNSLIYANQSGWRFPSEVEAKAIFTKSANPYTSENGVLFESKKEIAIWIMDYNNGEVKSLIKKNDGGYVVDSPGFYQELEVYAVKSMHPKEKIVFMDAASNINHSAYTLIDRELFANHSVDALLNWGIGVLIFIVLLVFLVIFIFIKKSGNFFV